MKNILKEIPDFISASQEEDINTELLTPTTHSPRTEESQEEETLQLTQDQYTTPDNSPQPGPSNPKKRKGEEITIKDFKKHYSNLYKPDFPMCPTCNDYQEWLLNAGDGSQVQCDHMDTEDTKETTVSEMTAKLISKYMESQEVQFLNTATIIGVARLSFLAQIDNNLVDVDITLQPNKMNGQSNIGQYTLILVGVMYPILFKIFLILIIFSYVVQTCSWSTCHLLYVQCIGHNLLSCIFYHFCKCNTI